MLGRKRKTAAGHYLPFARCLHYSWQKYSQFVNNIVFKQLLIVVRILANKDL